MKLYVVFVMVKVNLTDHYFILGKYFIISYFYFNLNCFFLIFLNFFLFLLFFFFCCLIISRCDGSIKYLHQDCLMEWLRVSKKNDLKCELCGEKFSFRRVYAPNTPTQLSLFEFIGGLIPIITSSIQKFLQVIIVCFCWIVLMPFGTMWWFNICLKYLMTGNFVWSITKMSQFDLLLLWWDGVIVTALIGLISICLLILLRPLIRVSKN